MRRTISRRLIGLLRDCAGTNMIEAAIVTPLLLLLTFSVVDFASLFYVYLSLENGVSQATRFAVTGQTMTDPGDPSAQLNRAESIKLAMRQATPTITLNDSAFSFSHMSPPAGAWTAGVGGPNDIEKVTVDLDWDLMTPLIRPFFTGGKIHFTVASAMKNESY
ncbi:MAG TPA: TadE/TadG family type IV pilus assembly protein [Vicinamibacterales bacterium]|jgi:Flp pilus assembly protein TadG